MQYVKSVLKKACYSELHDLFVNTTNPFKEITESYGAFTNLSSVMGWHNFNNSVFYHIGDGAHCCTGALFSFMSKSANWSIDPKVNIPHVVQWKEKYNVQRFDFLADYFEGVVFAQMLKTESRYNLVMVHSHVDAREVIKRFPNWDYIYVNPCCDFKHQTLDVDYQKKNNISTVLAGRDNQILSEKNEIYIYRNNKKVSSMFNIPVKLEGSFTSDNVTFENVDLFVKTDTEHVDWS